MSYNLDDELERARRDIDARMKKDFPDHTVETAVERDSVCGAPVIIVAAMGRLRPREMPLPWNVRAVVFALGMIAGGLLGMLAEHLTR